MKRIITLSIFLFWAVVSIAASRYWVGGHPTNNNWNQTGSSTTNWSATSGGAAGASVPGSSDNVFFDGAGTGNSTVTVSASPTVLSLTFTSGYTSTITINTGVALQVAGSFTDQTNHSWTVNGTGSLSITAASTITSNGKTFPGPVSFAGVGTTKTLVGNWTITGLFSYSSTQVLNWTTNETLSCGGITSSGAISGTAKIILTGGTWSGSSAIQNNLDIAGNVTVSGSVAYNTGTLTYVSGTVTTTGSTLTIAASTTLNTNGITWNNITISGSSTLTLNSLLSATGTFTINASLAVTFAGASGFTIGTFTDSHVSSGTITFNDGVTYTITTALNAFLSRNGSILTFTSDDATNTAALNLQQGATCNVLANFTRITNSGRTIRTFNGTVTSCTGIVAFNDIGTSKY